LEGIEIVPVQSPDPIVKSIQAGLLSWVLPGAGHWLLGQRGMALVFFLAVSIPYWTGLAFGGILDSINPRTNRWVFLAASSIGGYTLPCFVVSRTVETSVLSQTGLRTIPDPQRNPEEQKKFIAARAKYMAFFPESDVAQIYLAAAGLLNVLTILDAIARAQTGGLPTFHRESQPATEGEHVT
jgi:hypothetical protein